MSHDYQIQGSEIRFTGRVITVRSEQVRMPDGSLAVRDVVAHPGAVGVLAVGEQDRVLLIRQYRHPVGQRLWELPAGLLDQPGEPAAAAAARELVEEVGLRAGRWSVLVDGLSSPGMTDEAIRVYLAEDVHEVSRPPAVAEEAELSWEWVALPDAVGRVLGGQIRNMTACVGLLALSAMRAGGYPPRAADAPWPDRPNS